MASVTKSEGSLISYRTLVPPSTFRVEVIIDYTGNQTLEDGGEDDTLQLYSTVRNGGQDDALAIHNIVQNPN